MTSEVFSQAFSQGAAKAAGPTKKAQKKMRGSHVPRITLTGTLVSVDSEAGALRLKASGKELGMTAVTRAAKEALRKLKAGDRVRVSYTVTEGRPLALPAEEGKVRPRTKRMADKGGAIAEEK